MSWLNETATDQRILLTRFGRVVSVVDPAERLDATAEKVDITAREVVERFADLALARSVHWSLDEVCTKLGIDPSRVRERSSRLRG